MNKIEDAEFFLMRFLDFRRKSLMSLLKRQLGIGPR
jgi:hypothetical protein